MPWSETKWKRDGKVSMISPNTTEFDVNHICIFFWKCTKPHKYKRRRADEWQFVCIGMWQRFVRFRMQLVCQLSSIIHVFVTLDIFWENFNSVYIIQNGTIQCEIKMFTVLVINKWATLCMLTLVCMLYLCLWACWRQEMETFFTLLALCEGNPPVTGSLSAQWTSNAVFWGFLSSYLEQPVEQTAEWGWIKTPWRSCEISVIIVFVRDDHGRSVGMKTGDKSDNNVHNLLFDIMHNVGASWAIRTCTIVITVHSKVAHLDGGEGSEGRGHGDANKWLGNIFQYFRHKNVYLTRSSEGRLNIKMSSYQYRIPC